MQRYRVELEDLEDFVKRLQAFEERAEGITADVDKQVAELHGSWLGSAAEAHQAHHQEWTAAAAQMREAIGQLRAAATTAHGNYTEVVEMNKAMWP